VSGWVGWVGWVGGSGGSGGSARSVRRVGEWPGAGLGAAVGVGAGRGAGCGAGGCGASVDSAAVEQAWLEELSEWLRIPSISAERSHAQDVLRAGEWLCDFVRGAGGSAELVDWNGQPLALGELRASGGARDAPTILCYGHFDVQPPAPLDEWESPPFEPTVRDGWLYARGVADDKGQLYLLLKAAELLARGGSLPVNLRFACDGEEETGGHSIVEFLAEDQRGADACVIYDSDMERRGVPAFNLATRGLVSFDLRVRGGTRDLHSGMYGNAALNAVHALMQTLGGVLPRDGCLPEPLREGIAAVTEEERAAWAEVTPGARALEEAGAVPYDGRAGDEFYERTWARPAVDVNGILGGKPGLRNTTIPAAAQANFTIRLAPGQDVETIAAAAERLLREAAPEGATLELVRDSSAPPGLVSPDSPAIRLALEAFERALGVRPLLIRSGGTLPIVPALAEKGIPTVLTGFALPESNVHSPNERLLVEYVPLGVEAARELFRAFADLPR
jgi:acetylornithine deacetylase/succinyl-diaminopimelate desuccinylase-like protein